MQLLNPIFYSKNCSLFSHTSFSLSRLSLSPIITKTYIYMLRFWTAWQLLERRKRNENAREEGDEEERRERALVLSILY